MKTIAKPSAGQPTARLADAAYESLLEAILAGRIMPGTVISEVSLAKQLDISRTPVHDALRQLARDGLVEQRAHRRAVVATFSRVDIHEVFEMRKLLEGEAARRAATRIDRPTLTRLKETADALSASPDDPAWIASWADFDRDFHTAIATASGVSRLARDIERYQQLHHAINKISTTVTVLQRAPARTRANPQCAQPAQCRGCGERDGRTHRRMADFFRQPFSSLTRRPMVLHDPPKDPPMIRTARLSLLSLILILGGFVRTGVAGDPPLGDKNFYPSPDRPVGFRGDGNGYFPGATPVSEWREGTVAKSGDNDALIIIDHKSHNVVWKTEMPAWANSQPTVVGDRVFTTAEPNLLVCVDAASGKIRWTVATNPWELKGIDPSRAEKIQAMYDIWRDAIPHFDCMCHETTIKRILPSSEFVPIANVFVETVLPRVVTELKTLDPGGPYDDAAAVTADALKRYGMALTEWEQGKTGQNSPAAKHDPIFGQMTRLMDLLGNRIDTLGGFTGSGKSRTPKIPLEVPWGHLVGFCGSAPVSDGQYVYASFGQGQTICCDLDGKRIWGTFVPPNSQSGDLSSLQSPLLIGDVLVDMHCGTNSEHLSGVLRGLDKRTGKLLWEAPAKGHGLRNGGGYCVGSHKAVRLNSGSKSIDVVVTTFCNIIRAKDGLEIGTLPFEYPPSGGPSMISNGDIVVKGAVGDNYRTPYIGYRLQLVADDKVEAKEICARNEDRLPAINR